MKKQGSKVIAWLSGIQRRFVESTIIHSIHSGLEMAIPFLIVGAFALMLNNFPLAVYQNFIKEIYPVISTILVFIYTYTLGSISIILCFTISLSFATIVGETDEYLYPIVTLASYMAFVGGSIAEGTYVFSAQWMFTAIVITLLACYLFRFLRGHNVLSLKLHTTGASYLYNTAVLNLLPIALIIILFAVAGGILTHAFGGSDVTNFGSNLLLYVFRNMNDGLGRTLLYVLLMHVFWFFGIHGSNTLDAVATNIFDPVVEQNAALVALGQTPGGIYSGTFFNTFVFMGGSGTTICLLLAILLFSRRKPNKRMAGFALPTALFNINEIILFGYPIILNPFLLIPFLATPLLLSVTSALAMNLGLVPVAAAHVEWTMPALLSGYLATGSVAGSLLQLFNIALGVAVYVPFIRLYEGMQRHSFEDAAKQMSHDVSYGEMHEEIPVLTGRGYPHNYYAKALAADIRNALLKKEIELFYQPQIRPDHTLHGLEALLRYRHPLIGYVSPPLVIELATEIGIMDDLTFYVMEKANQDARKIRSRLSGDICISVNISPHNLEHREFETKVKQIFGDFERFGVAPVLELTERKIMKATEYTERHIRALKEHGIGFSIDDFGMGHNSFMHLQENLFDEVKLDGNLITKIASNERSREIVSGILALSKSLNFRVVAEYVETEEEKQILQGLGCRIYQGYLYSKALPAGELDAYIDGLPKKRVRRSAG